MTQTALREVSPEEKALPAAIVDQLLDKLATDDVFRALFTREPAAALKQLGFQPSASQVMCLTPGKLADKATIGATRDAMREVLILGVMAQKPNTWTHNKK